MSERSDRETALPRRSRRRPTPAWTKPSTTTPTTTTNLGTPPDSAAPTPVGTRQARVRCGHRRRRPRTRPGRSPSSPSASRSLPACSPPSPATADIHAVIVRNGIVLYAPGELNLGRNTRLANRAQRRALRGLYKCCAIPGCTVAYDRCKLHHIIWWRTRRPHRLGQPPARLPASTTPTSTTTTGTSNSDPTANSPSASPTASIHTTGPPEPKNRPPDPR
jgi:hypothetical protein